jgi:16S rRNA (cytosine967-C5)-methyltransferase
MQLLTFLFIIINLLDIILPLSKATYNMTKLPFRDHHLLNLLNGYQEQGQPLDLFISLYFRENVALGSKDRAFLAETIYSMIRWQGLLDYLATQPATWEKRYAIFREIDINDYRNKEVIPLHIRLSFPQDLFDLIAASHGIEKAAEICMTSNSPAPTTVRINPLKTTREEMMQRWESQYSISQCKMSPYGIIFHKKINFFELPEFKAGLFEVQDEGSQLLADLMEPKPGQLVLDYCSGSGGKTLAFAHKMNLKGQIYLHDIRKNILFECRRRLKRAGIQNSQIILADDPKLQKIKKKMDWVLVDAPCTGTGTMRRNPDMKWKFSAEMLYRLVGQQRTIFEKALSYLHPNGKIIYATCSILNQENQQQIEHFIKTYNLKLDTPPFHTIPTPNGMDGFFAAVLTRAS